jgi:FKBP-type peptidyl-prolyl cis-trans isomerase SlyD
VAVEGDTITVDANHPLAGETLTFDVTIREVRPATTEEISHGHVHGQGCCGGNSHSNDDECCGGQEESKSGGCGCH